MTAARRFPTTAAACVAALLLCGGWFAAPAACAQEVPDLPAAGPAPAGDPAGGELAGGDGTWLLGLTPLEWAIQTGPFLIASLIALGYGVERLVSLRTGRVLPPAFVRQFFHLLESGRLTKRGAEEACEESGSPVSEVFRHAVRKWGRPAVEVEQAVIDGGMRQVSLLKRNLRVLNAVATVTPLMGLLGTVLGMIRAFAKIAGGGGAMGDADQLAAGIVTALLTTALGLTVAIPSLILYFYLSGRVEWLVMRMDELADQVVRHVAGDEGDDEPADAPAPPAARPPAARTANGRAAKPDRAGDRAPRPGRRIPVRTDPK